MSTVKTAKVPNNNEKFVFRSSVYAGNNGGNANECGAVNRRGAASKQSVLSAPTLALLTLQVGLHICQRIISAEPSVLYFSPLLESIRLQNSEV